MTQSSIRRCWSPSAMLPLALLLISVLLTGCSISASSRSSTAADADAHGRSSGRSESRGNSRASVHGSAKAEAKAGGSSTGSADVSGQANGKASGKSSSKIVFKSKKRVSGVGKAKGGDHFKATALVGGGKGKVKINGKVTGSAGTKAGASKGKSGSSTSSSGGKGSVKVSAGGSTKSGGSIKGGGSAKAEGKGKGSVRVDSKGASNADKAASLEGDKSKGDKSKGDKSKGDKSKGDKSKGDKSKGDKSKGDKSKGDKPDAQIPEVPVVIDPPDEAPENDFGYDTPVRGCFEGIVYPLAPQTKKLPTTWDPADGISVVYACEWDIPTRKWEVGFPGVEDRFEWFAIQYSGSFNVETAGKWKFRISSDDGSKLYIDGKLVLDNDGEHPPKEIEIEVDLATGDHEMVLEYFQGPRYHINLQLYATPPGGEEGIFSVR